jgi:hypothetical protein
MWDYVSDDIKAMVGYSEVHTDQASPQAGVVGRGGGGAGRWGVWGGGVGGGARGEVAKAKGEGSFFMCWEDFYMHFDRIYLCKLPRNVRGAGSGAGGERVTVSGEWSLAAGSAGGCSNHGSCASNPQFRLVVPSVRSRVLIRLLQSSTAVGHARRYRVDSSASNHIGLYVVKVAREEQTRVALASIPSNHVHAAHGGGGSSGGGRGRSAAPAAAMVAKTQSFSNVWQTSVKLRPEIELGAWDEVAEGARLHAHPASAPFEGHAAAGSRDDAENSFVLIPCTYEPGFEGRFTLEVTTDPGVPVVLQQITQRPHKALVQGEWMRSCAGGCLNHRSWRRNPCFLLTLPPRASPAQLPEPSLELSLQNPAHTCALGMYLFRSKERSWDGGGEWGGGGAGRLTREGVEALLSPQSIVAENRVFVKGHRVTLELQGLGPGQYVVLVATYEPAELLAPFRLVAYSSPAAPATLDALPPPAPLAGEVEGHGGGRGARGLGGGDGGAASFRLFPLPVNMVSCSFGAG